LPDLPVKMNMELKKVCQSTGIYVRYIDMSFGENLEGKPSAFSCPAASSFCEINSDGTVLPCPLSRVEIPAQVLSFDNVRRSSIRAIWNGRAFSKFREWRGFGCDGGIAFESCGRCVAHALDDWLRAEAELTEPKSLSAAA